MKRFQYILLFVAVVFCAAGGPARAQKKPLDHDVYDGWQSVRSVKLTPDGNLVSYEVNPQEGDGTLYIRNLQSGAELAVERRAHPAFAVEVKPLENFFEAEEYHQDYLDKNPEGYCHVPKATIAQLAATPFDEGHYRV